MTDEQLEQQITFATLKFQNQPSPENWQSLKDLIAQRSQEQVEKMESERGLLGSAP